MTRPAARPAALPTFDLAAIERAEAAMRSLSRNFDAWMADELSRLVAARAAAKQAEWAEPELQTLHLVANDIKGGGETYNYPLATLLAASLCKLLDSAEKRVCARRRPILIDAHVDAVRVVVDRALRKSDHSVGRELLAELEKQVADLLGPLANQ